MKHFLRNDWNLCSTDEKFGRFLYHETCSCPPSAEAPKGPEKKEKPKIEVFTPEDLERAKIREEQQREKEEIEEAEQELADIIDPVTANNIAECCKPKPELIIKYHSLVSRDPKLAEIVVAKPTVRIPKEIDALENNINIVEERLAAEEEHKDNPVAQGLWKSFGEKDYRLYDKEIPSAVLDYLENLTEEEKDLLRPCFNGDGDGSYLGIRCFSNKNNKNLVRTILLATSELQTRGIGLKSKAPDLATIDPDGVISFVDGADPSLDEIIPDNPKFQYLVIERTVDGELLVDVAEKRSDGKYYYANNKPAKITSGYMVKSSTAEAFEDTKEHEEVVEEEEKEKALEDNAENNKLIAALGENPTKEKIAEAIKDLTSDERLALLAPLQKLADGKTGNLRKLANFLPKGLSLPDVFELYGLPPYTIIGRGGDKKIYSYENINGEYKLTGEYKDGQVIKTNQSPNDFPIVNGSEFLINYRASSDNLSEDPESEWSQKFHLFEQRSRANQVEFLLHKDTSIEERRLYLSYAYESKQSLAVRLSAWSQESNGKDFEQLFFHVNETTGRYQFNNYGLEFLNNHLVAHWVFDPATTEYIQEGKDDYYYFSKERNEYIHWKTKTPMMISGEQTFLKISAAQMAIQNAAITRETEKDRGNIIDKQKAKEEAATLILSDKYRKNKIKNLNGELEDDEFKKQNEEIIIYYQRIQKHGSVHDHHDHEHYEAGNSLALEDIGTANPEPNADGTYDVRLHGSMAAFCYNPATNEAVIKNRGEGRDLHFPMEEQSIASIKLFSYLGEYGGPDALDINQVGEEDLDSRQLVNRMNDLFPVEGSEYFRPGQMKEIANTLFYMKGKSFFWLLNHIEIQKGNTTERLVNNDENASATSRMEMNQNAVLDNRVALRNFLEDLGDKVINADRLYAHMQQNNGRIALQANGSLLQNNNILA